MSNYRCNFCEQLSRVPDHLRACSRLSGSVDGWKSGRATSEIPLAADPACRPLAAFTIVLADREHGTGYRSPEAELSHCISLTFHSPFFCLNDKFTSLSMRVRIEYGLYAARSPLIWLERRHTKNCHWLQYNVCMTIFCLSLTSIKYATRECVSLRVWSCFALN